MPAPAATHRRVTRTTTLVTLVVLLLPVWLTASAGPAGAAEHPTSECGTLDIGCYMGNLAADFITTLAQNFVEATGDVVQAVASFWVAVPTPQLATDASGTPSDPVAFLQSSLGFYTGVLATVATAIGIARIAWESRSGGHSREAHNLARHLITFISVNTWGLAAMWGGVEAGDAFSVWILERSTGSTDFAANMTAVLGLSAASGLTAILLAFLAFFAMIFGLLQLVAMIGRGAGLVIMAGVWPTAASFRTTEYGEQWYRRITAGLIGLVLYKPACAIIYAAAFRLVGQDAFGQDGTGLVAVATGLFMLVLAVFALPALARFAVPLVAAAHFRGGSGGGAEAVGAAAAGAAVVGGYVQSSSGAGSPPPPPSPGPAGAWPAGGGGPAAAGSGATGGPAGAAAAAGAQLVGAGAGAANRTVDNITGDDR